MNNSEIKLYKTPDGKASIEVKLENDTVWLSLIQISALFERDKSVISRHINNIFKEDELERFSTVAKYATVQKEGKREVLREIEYFNLDAIISVGYRVNSKRGILFRKWATQLLKDYLIKGYALNQQKLQQQADQLKELKGTIKILGSTLDNKELTNDESKGLLEIISDYSYALEILDKYDHQLLSIEGTPCKDVYQLTYQEVVEQIELVKRIYGSSELFGREKDDSLKSSIGTIYQTFNGNDLYPGIEEKAANLLYLIVKNHSFSDGNKRIAAFIFLYFLEKNRMLFTDTGRKIISDNTLVALTLMIAVSKTKEKDTMIKVVVNLIGKSSLEYA